ncbi:mannosyltransferase family protein [Paenibacillus mucilaginosus]|uniref:Glycosyltransferase RgtA/B/C/D-like domain-containing protein n=1 Tax=Paenibacillus mucilaginosus (strain KNP414) TaxID=1036673 RepID=F8FQH9_PAEMK|nr:mannosyltransferase family protein [Paenibacillus mucilaginosus]AEI39240.1 hypothetical protein KNP414_00636 [Paenibacillus mucilaginosus KNP414]MCG7217119.1 hypothetical protein [Paenibacillus mucilaginosus]WDM28247.1 hypothetical protein KCX80_03015 [Paenibacillus mucilaginosus]
MESTYKLNKRIAIIILFAVIISRMAIYLSFYLGANTFPSYVKIPEYIKTGDNVQLQLPYEFSETRIPQFSDLNKFDARNYLHIAQHGYDKFSIYEKHSNANWVFFPLFPMTVKIVQKLFSFLSFEEVGVILSNVFLYLALLLLYIFSRNKGLSENKSLLLILLILIFPTSLFFSIAYTESLFLLLSSASLYFNSKKKYGLAIMMGSLSTITRTVGFVNVVYTFILLLIDKKKDWKLKDVKWFIYGILSTFPLIGYFFYMKKLTGDFFAPLHEQSINWDRKTMVPFTNVSNYIKESYFISHSGWDNGFISFLMSTAVVLVFLIYIIVSRKKLIGNWHELAFFVYALLLTIIPFSSGHHLTSITRYLMVVIPFYFYLIEIAEKRREFLFLYVFLFGVLNIYYCFAFINDYFFVV